MATIEWEIGASLFASVLVDPRTPVKMSFFFFPKEDVNDATLHGRIGDLRTDNDVVENPANPALEGDDDPYLTFIATLVPGRPTQNSYDFDLVFFDRENRDAWAAGTPLEDLDFLSRVPFKDTFDSRFLILDERLDIEYFEWA